MVERMWAYRQIFCHAFVACETNVRIYAFSLSDNGSDCTASSCIRVPVGPINECSLNVATE